MHISTRLVSSNIFSEKGCWNLNLTNNAQRLLEYVASRGYEVDAKDIYSALHMDKTVLLSAIYKLMQNGLKVTTTSDNEDIRTVHIKKTRVLVNYLKNGVDRM